MAANTTSVAFDPAKDIPSLQGKVILVTGGNEGLGKQAVCEYAKHSPKQIWLAARNVARAQAVVDEVHQTMPDSPVKVLKLDLTSFDSIKKGAQEFVAESDRLDILMLNAGIMATAPALTENGYEVQFGTNHMGHALLTKLLLPTMQKTAEATDADVRIVSLSSEAHNKAPRKVGGIQFGGLKTTQAELQAFDRYGQSKLANILYAKQLAAHYPQITVASVHPGVVRTNLINGMSGTPFLVRYLGPVANYFFTPVSKGVKNQLWASVANNVKSGEYYEPVGVGGKASKFGQDEELAKKLWDWTTKELEGWTL